MRLLPPLRFLLRGTPGQASLQVSGVEADITCLPVVRCSHCSLVLPIHQESVAVLVMLGEELGFDFDCLLDGSKQQASAHTMMRATVSSPPPSSYLFTLPFFFVSDHGRAGRGGAFQGRNYGAQLGILDVRGVEKKKEKQRMLLASPYPPPLLLLLGRVGYGVIIVSTDRFYAGGGCPA